VPASAGARAYQDGRSWRTESGPDSDRTSAYKKYGPAHRVR